MTAPIGQDSAIVVPGPYSLECLGYAAHPRRQRRAAEHRNRGIPTGARRARISIETAAARYRDDGTAPTASVGMPIPAGNWPPLDYDGDLTAIGFIAESGAPVLNVSFYK